jgi:hypothetical protein
MAVGADDDEAGTDLTGVLEDRPGRGASGAGPQRAFGLDPGPLELPDDVVHQLLGLFGAVAHDRGRHRVVELADVQDVDGPTTHSGQLDSGRHGLAAVLRAVDGE